MELTTAAKLLAKFEKLSNLYVTGDGKSVTPIWLQNVILFLQEHYHKTADINWLAKQWDNDGSYDDTFHDTMKIANEQYKDLTISNKNINI